MINRVNTASTATPYADIAASAVAEIEAARDKLLAENPSSDEELRARICTAIQVASIRSSHAEMDRLIDAGVPTPDVYAKVITAQVIVCAQVLAGTALSATHGDKQMAMNLGRACLKQLAERLVDAVMGDTDRVIVGTAPVRPRDRRRDS